MNVAILIDDISRSAGTERAVTNLANNLLKYSNDYKVTIISAFADYSVKPYYELNSKVLIENLNFKMCSLVKRGQLYKLIAKKLQEIIQLNQIDVIIGTTHALNFVIDKVDIKIKKIACEHMNYYSCPIYSRIVRYFVYKRFDKLVLLTEKDKERYNFIASEKKCVIPNSLSFENKILPELSEKRIIAVGRLTKQKGFDRLIHFSKELKKQLPDWHIDIFGDGEDKEKLLHLIEKNRVTDYVRINSPTKEIVKELLSSSIYVMTSRWEGLPMILIEAKICGLPIVSFDCPEGPADIIVNGKDGFLVKNKKEFVDKVVYLSQDKQIRNVFSKNAICDVKKFESEKIFQKWDTLLKFE